VIRGRRCGDGVFERCPLAAGTVGYQRGQRGEGVGHGELLAVALVGAQALASNRPDKACDAGRHQWRPAECGVGELPRVDVGKVFLEYLLALVETYSEATGR